MIKNLHKNKEKPALIDLFDEKTKAENELASLKSSFSSKFNRLNELRNKEQDLKNEIYLLENSGNAYDEFTVERKRQELSKSPGELESAELEFQELNDRISFLKISHAK
jgi:septal ring factor EnvC (AmiA/AmiB activator)